MKKAGSRAQGSKAADSERLITEQPGQKVCFNCGTTETPLGRRGPDGAKKLCNACGLKSRKYEAFLGPTKKNNKRESRHGKKVALQKKLNALANLFLSHKSSKERRWNNLSTDDQAALMLMSLGS